MKIPQQHAEGVADAAVGFAGLLEEFFAEGDFVLVIDAADPEADHVAAVLVVVVVGGHGLGGLAGALVALADLFAAGIDDEAVGDDAFIRSGIAGDDAHHEAALEPAAMLVGGLDVEIRWAMQLGMAIQNADVAATGVDPHVERVVATFGIGRQADGVCPPGVVFFKPEIGALLFDDVGDPADDGLIHDDGAVGRVKNGQRDAPGALAADAPVGPAADGAMDAVARGSWQPGDLVDFSEGLFTDGINADEELLNGAEDDGCL